jgi:hypothetical protein
MLIGYMRFDGSGTSISGIFGRTVRQLEISMKMKQLLSGAAIAAVLTITAPVWAQNAPPAPATAAPATTSAMPPMHHAQRHAKAMHAFHKHMARKAALTGDTTAQLNREELARIQQGAPPSSPPPAPEPAPASQDNPSGGNSLGLPGPNTGGPGLTPYSGGGAPQR